MTEKNTPFRTLRCILTAHRIERCWRKISRLKKKNRPGRICTRSLRKTQEAEAWLAYLTQLYRILTKGADHPERLAI